MKIKEKQNNQLNDWKQLEEDTLKNLYNYFTELHQSIHKLRRESKEFNDPFTRAQLCISLITIDTFSRFSLMFDGIRGDDLENNNKKRFKKWVREYVINDKNQVFVKNKQKLSLNEDLFWKIRNSFLHFYSFPKIDEDKGVRLSFEFGVPNDFSIKVKNHFKEKGFNIKHIDLYLLIDSIFEGIIIWFSSLKQKIKDNPEKYIESICYVNEIVKNENAKTILIEDKK
ncbi:hypothetical protein KKH36_01245 [Patescibacteria group bacterium]|nr:hypothetical protein [Patescibacteria group bacterium]